MKKMSMISKIILIIQVLMALYLPLWPILDLLNVDVLLPVIMYGIYVSIPLAIVGILFCLIVLFKNKDKKCKIKSIIFVLLHMLIGLWNFVIYNSLWHI